MTFTTACPSHGTQLVQSTYESTGSGSAVSGPTLPVAPSGAVVFPQNPVLDAFARPDGPLGSAWASPAASPFAVSIAGGRTAGTASGGGAVWNAAALSDLEVYGTLTAVPSAAHSWSLLFRVQNQTRDGLPPATNAHHWPVPPATQTGAAVLVSSAPLQPAISWLALLLALLRDPARA